MNDYDVVIKGGRVIDPETGLDAVRNVGIQGEKIAAVTEKPIEGKQTIDATGHVVSPGFIDLSVRLREPGHTRKGNIQSETRAAAAAGATVGAHDAVAQHPHRRCECPHGGKNFGTQSMPPLVDFQTPPEAAPA